MKTMEQRPIKTPPTGPRYNVGAIIDNIDTNKGIKWGGGIVGAGALLYWTAPEIHNLVMERQNLLGLMLFGGGIALAASKNERGHVSFRDRPMGRNAAIFIGSTLAIAGGLLAGNNARGEWFGGDDSDSVPVAEVVPPVSFVSGDTMPQVVTSTVVNSDGSSCEILIDFNNVSQADIDSGRYVQDAQRLQYTAYGVGGYQEFGAVGDYSPAELETYVDGELGTQSKVAVAHLRETLGLPPVAPETPSWGAEMCNAMPVYSDGDPNTPDFTYMPDLRFEGYQGQFLKTTVK